RGYRSTRRGAGRSGAHTVRSLASAIVLDIKRSPARVRIVLDAPHGNAITDAMIAVLRSALRSIGPPVKLVTIETAGSDFSFGASIDEHAPARIADVLPRFHSMIVELLRVPAVTAAVVPGR